MVNLEEVNKRVTNSHISFRGIAKELGISPASVKNKLDGKTKFYVDEVDILSKMLHLTVGERNSIFFA